MIDSVYEMMERIKSSYPNVHVVDVRGTLPARSDWHDELHPSSQGFKKVAKLFNQVISRALGARAGNNTSGAVPLPGPPVDPI